MNNSKTKPKVLGCDVELIQLAQNSVQCGFFPNTVTTVKFKILTTVNIKIIIFWLLTQCSPLELYLLPLSAGPMLTEEAGSSETSVKF